MKILTIQNRIGIGDMVIFLPFIEAIAKKFATPVYLLAKESSKASEILKSNKNIKEVIILDRSKNKNGYHDGLLGSLNLIKQLKVYNFDKLSYASCQESLVNVPKSQHWKDIIIKESQWFNVNEQQAYKAMNYCFENYDDVKAKSFNLMKTNRDKFTLDKILRRITGFYA